MIRLKKLQGAQQGFTIIELLIATMVFSSILLVITYGVLHFTNTYYKSINTSLTQNTTRSAINLISQDIQFGSQTTATPDLTKPDNPTYPHDYSFCAGGKIYKYTQGLQFSGTPGHNNWGLYRLDDSSGCSGGSNGTELLSARMRVSNITLTSQGSTGLWTVDIRIAYGDDDLLSGSAGNPTDPDAQCKLTIGSQFCAVSELSTNVSQRGPAN